MKNLTAFDDDFRTPKDSVNNGRHASNGLPKIPSSDQNFKQRCGIEAAKYPFLTQAQIKQRVANSLKKRQLKDDRSKMSKLKPETAPSSKKDSRQALQPAKRPLVPLDVNVSQANRSGSLKKLAATNGKKRSVTFNKKLYIRYCTSEESSNTTSMDRKRDSRMNGKLLSPKKKVKASDGHKSSMYADKSNMERKFEQLLNDKCSWSYRSHRIIKTNIVSPQSKESSLQLESTVMTFKESGNCYDDPIEKDSDIMKAGSCSKDEPRKNKATQKKNPKSVKKAPQMMKKTKRATRKKTNSKVSTKTVNSKRVTPNSNLKGQEGIESSSSDEEVLQTRYSIKNAKFVAENEYDSGSALSDTEQKAEGTPLENKEIDPKTDTPIIIQVKACNGYESSNESWAIQKTGDSPPPTNSSKNNSQHNDLNDNDEGSLIPESSALKSAKENRLEEAQEENPEIENEKLVNITSILNLSDSVFSSISDYSNGFAPSCKERNSSDDAMISPSLKGSFDLNTYQDKSEHSLPKTIPARNDKKRKIRTPKLFNYASDAFKNIHDASKEIEYEGEENNKTSEKPVIQYLTLPADKRKGTRPKKSNFGKTPRNNYQEHATADKKFQKKATNDSPSLRSKSHLNSKNKSVEYINVESTDDASENKRKNRRSCSLAATKRIRAIGKFENSASSSDSDIKFLGEEKAPAAVLKNIKRRLNSIAQNKNGQEVSSFQNKTENDFDAQNIEDKGGVKNWEGKNQSSSRPIKSKKATQNKSLQNSSKSDSFFFGRKKVLLTKGKQQKNTNKEIVQDLDLSDESFSDSLEDNNFQGPNFYNEAKERKAKNKPLSKQSGNKCSEISLQNKRNSLNQCSMSKTWSDLEKELLDDSEPEIAPTDKKIYSTVVIKKERLVQKDTKSKNSNLWEVSNTSMTQTTGKFVKVDRVNMQYAERNYYESSSKMNKYQNRRSFENTLLNEIIPIKPKSPLEKAIAAMKQCTAGVLETSKKVPLEGNLVNESFISKESCVESYEKKTFKTKLRTAEISSPEENELEFGSDHLKENSDAFDNQNNNKIKVGNFNMPTNCSEHKNFDSAFVNSYVYSLLPWTNKFEPEKQNHSSALIQLDENNPWDTLRRNLKLDEEVEEKRIESTQNQEEPLNESIEFNEEFEYEPFEKETEKNPQSGGDCSVLDHSLKGKNELKKVEIENNSNITKSPVLHPRELLNQMSRKRSISQCNNTDTIKNKKKALASDKSAVYKFEADNRGALILTLHSNKSSISDISVDSSKATKDVTSKACTVKAAKMKPNMAKDAKAKEKYIKYLKGLETLKTNFMPNNEDEMAQKLLSHNKNLDVSKKVVDTDISESLIAENDNDVFSLSSSDTDNASSDVNTGTGLLCEFFDP